METPFDLTHATRIEAAKEYVKKIGNAAAFDHFLDGCAWMMSRLANRSMVAIDGTKLEIRHGHVVYDIFQRVLEQTQYAIPGADEETERLYKAKEDARFALIRAERQLHEHLNKMHDDPSAKV